jgi:hypothetical protein
MKLSERKAQQPLRCCICHGDEEEERLLTCDACGTLNHHDCIGALDTCPTLGCGAPVKSEEKPKGPTIILTAMGSAIAKALEEEDKKLPWYGRRFEAATLEDDCHWCGLPEDHHAGTKDHCPINAASLLEGVKYEREQKQMKQAGEDYRALLAHQKNVFKKVCFCIAALLLLLATIIVSGFVTTIIVSGFVGR